MVRRLFGLNKKLLKRSDGDKEKVEAESNREASAGSSESADQPATGPTEGASERPSSSYDASSSRATSSFGTSSVFSRSRQTGGTGASSATSGSTYNRGKHGNTHTSGSRFEDVGKPLRMVDHEKFSYLNPVPEEEGPNESNTVKEEGGEGTQSSTANSTHARAKVSRALDEVENELNILEDKLVGLMDDINQNVTSISKAVMQAIEFFKQFLPSSSVKGFYRVTFERYSSLRNIGKIFLHFMDNLLISEAFGNSRSILIRRYVHFLKRLNINVFEGAESESQTLPCLSNFCIDADCNLPNRTTIGKIIDEIVSSDPLLISDCDGAFIAPILRGLSRKSALLTVMFGVPSPQQEHYDIVKALYCLFPDVHFFCIKDCIKPCAEVMGSVPRPMAANTLSNTPAASFQFSPPYRLAPDALSPPMSMSLSSSFSSKTSGTLGGYLFPQIEKGSKLSHFSGASFAVTCSHVVLSESQDYPYVSIPSKVLQNTYMNTLIEESHRYAKDSPEEKAFVGESLRIQENMKWQEENKFGQVVWGERSIVNQRLSDFAIIKVGSQYKCENCLGVGLTGVPDPTLRFQNMYVKQKILNLKPGMRVFKIGAATNYTSGSVSTARLVYWADGKLQSSEFVVSSPLPLFASAGDSGSWILTKLETKVGLGVVGMLHSYDGENRQFGLFTPIGDILERLQSVTGVMWDIDCPLDE